MRRITICTLLLPLCACGEPLGPRIEGSWGGTVASLSLTRAGGTVQYQCGAGTIDRTWTVSGNGVFSATGQHAFGGGPVPVGGRPSHPAVYTGVITGDVFALRVEVTDLDVTLGPFELTRNGPTVTEICF